SRGGRPLLLIAPAPPHILRALRPGISRAPLAHHSLPDRDPAPAGNGDFRIELRTILLLGFAYGFAFFDRMAMSFLSPFVAKDLQLSNLEIGALGSGLSLTWALSAYLI